MFYHLKTMYIEEDNSGIFSYCKIKDYNVMIDGKKSFDQSVKNDLRRFENIRKTAKKITQLVLC